MTDVERLLWHKLRCKQIHGISFYRQKPIRDYIVDFYAPKAKLVIELDGSQHFDKEEIEKDKARDVNLEKLGLTVLRFNNRQVLEEIEGVMNVIYEIVGERI